MPVARAIRRPFRLVFYFRENPNTSFQIALRNIVDELAPEVVGGIKNLVEHGLGTPLEMDGLAAAICRRAAALDPAVFLETIEQAGQSRAFDPHPFRDFLLGKRVSALGKMNERSPFSLAEPERAEPLVEPGAPGPGSAEENQAKLADIRRRHAR